MKLAGIVPLFLSTLGSAAAGSSCDVDLFKTVGVISPSDDAISIVKQDTSSVSFTVSNKWADHDTDMDFVFLQYTDPTTGHVICSAFANVETSWTSSEVEAGCMVNRPISVVTVHVVDAAFLGGNVGSLPTCCGDDSAVLDDAVESNSKTVSYTYILECTPVACTPEDCVTPDTTTEAPDATTQAPDATTDAPDATTEAPDATTEAPKTNNGKKPDKEKAENNGKGKSSTRVEIPNGEDPPSATCECTDKSGDTEDGDGFVTGGGWIYLDPETTYVDSTIVGVASFPADTKANFGFNAKHKKTVADGSTNFVIDGNAFHFHSGTGPIDYQFLEVPDSIRARWWGTGHLSTADGTAKDGDVYSFLVAVQDWGEPGYNDTWRIRIWETDGDETLVFDTNQDVEGVEWELDPDEDENDRFLGTELGELTADGGGNGGGNIQIHRSKKGAVTLLADDDLCICDSTPPDNNGGAFVTGGGWINMADAIRNTTGTPDFDLDDIKANFGFNAKFKKGNNKPDGSTNFDFEGGEFHFHSETGGNVYYDFLEIPSPTEARWMGKGTISSSTIEYGFMVAVQDLGEPGLLDTWRLRIWDIADGGLTMVTVAGTDHPVVPAKYVFDTNPEWPTEYDDDDRFLGTQLGEDDLVTNGGGNVQIHWKK